MKKIFLIVFFTFLLGTTIHASNDVRIKLLYGKNEIKTDTAPIIVNNRTLVPVRAIFETIGADVQWNNETKTVTAKKGEINVELTINSTIMRVNNEEITLDSPAIIRNNRTLVPIRACAESFDLTVEWFDNARIVKIKQDVRLTTAIEYSNGNYHRFTYDENGNLLKEEQPHQSITYTYDEMGNILTRSPSSSYSVIYTYDQYGNVKTSSGNYSTTEYFYDNNRLLIYQLNSSKFSPTPVKTTFTYDEDGKLIYSENENGYWEKSEYDENGNRTFLQKSDGDYRKSEYDQNGKLLYDENCYSGITMWNKYTYDENKVICERSDGIKEITTYENGKPVYYESDTFWKKYFYNNEGLLIESESQNGKTTYTYDEYGNLIKEDHGDDGWVEYSYQYYKI